MATTWSNPEAYISQAVCTTGTESAPTLATQGLTLKFLTGFEVYLSADSTKTLSGAGTLQAFRYSNFLGRWARAPEFDIVITGALATGITGARDATFKAGGYGVGISVVSSRDSIAYVPNGVTVSGGGVTINIVGVPRT